jgi:hypothetical protein
VTTDINSNNCFNTSCNRFCFFWTDTCDKAIQVCVDRCPPEKWECVEKTPAQTPKPTNKSNPPPTSNPIWINICTIGNEILLDNQCTCAIPSFLALGESGDKLTPSKTNCSEEPVDSGKCGSFADIDVSYDYNTKSVAEQIENEVVMDINSSTETMIAFLRSGMGLQQRDISPFAG